MKILLTGAFGFIGRVLLRTLAESGHDLIAAGRPSQRDLPPAAGAGPPITSLYVDLSRDRIQDRLDGGVEAVVHAAATSPDQGKPLARMIEDNLQATANLVEFALKAGAKKFVFTSSISVYGRVESPVVDESTPIIDPDPYGLTKLLGELILEEASPHLPSVSLRLPGVLGKGNNRIWLAHVVRKAARDEEIPVYHPDAPFNNAVHVLDLAGFVGSLLEREWTGRQAFPLAAAEPMTVGEVVETIVASLNSKSKIKEVEATRPSFVISSRWAEDRFGYTPRPIRTLLERFVHESGNHST
ncbi:MAG: NAD(P)-dependent oxidoreductase [Thermodesulfobacteriota bacterium]